VPAGATVVGVPARVLERAPKGDRSLEAGRA
jgi:serine acetyltransferase